MVEITACLAVLKKCQVTIYVIFTLMVLLLGIIIGYHTATEAEKSAHSIHVFQNTVTKRDKRSGCQTATLQTLAGERFYKRFLERYDKKFACMKGRDWCWSYGLPRNYIAYHVNSNSITIDGNLNEDAWKEVPWSETFVDIRSEIYPKPNFDTQFKMRWSDEKLYVGAVIQEKHIWATHKLHDSQLWTDNSFGLFIAVDGSLFNYKQIEVNVLGTFMDLLMRKSYWDSYGETVYDLSWDSDTEVGIHTEGTINTPGDEDKFWSVEIAIPFHKLSERTNRPQSSPRDNEVWFVSLTRSEHHLINVNGQYEKDPNSTTMWWTWQPCGAANLHLQDRWGLVQFKKYLKDTQFTFPEWHIYKALFETNDALKVYRARFGIYTDAIDELDLPPYLFSRMCVEIPEIRLKNNSSVDYEISVKTMLLSRPPSYIRSDRHVII